MMMTFMKGKNGKTQSCVKSGNLRSLSFYDNLLSRTLSGWRGNPAPPASQPKVPYRVCIVIGITGASP